MAAIGKPLTSPESGWKRYDGKYEMLKYTGKWSDIVISGAYGGDIRNTTTLNDTVAFRFKGTKIRVMADTHPSSGNNIEISVDGLVGNYTQRYGTTDVPSTLVYEKVGLDDILHTVIITNNSSCNIDAIDIDSTGRLVHPDEVTDIKDLDVGKRIRCHYQSLISGQFGVFSGLGQETSDFIPVVSTAKPNGDFYFIMVENWNKKKILIADRNIQHTISWDTLNNAGIASGSGLPLTFDGYSKDKTNFSVRLLTGGTASTDKDNEWDKYIVSSTLNGAITARDNNVWNWNIPTYTWTSTTGSTSANRLQRGNSSLGVSGYAPGGASSQATTSQGFRPVLEIEMPTLNKSFILFNGEHQKWVEEIPARDTVYSSNLIPIMTSNATPSGIASASSIIDTGRDAWRAFDGSNINTSDWATSLNTIIGWLQYQFPTQKKIRKYVIKTIQTASSPTEWSFKGSNDGVKWDVLDTQSNVVGWDTNKVREFKINNNNLYTVYRLDITKNNGGSTVQIGELEMMELLSEPIPAVPPSWKTISTKTPSVDTFKSEGMNDLSILNRKSTTFNYGMGASGSLGSGKTFKKTIDLKKLFEITNINVK